MRWIEAYQSAVTPAVTDAVGPMMSFQPAIILALTPCESVMVVEASMVSESEDVTAMLRKIEHDSPPHCRSKISCLGAGITVSPLTSSLESCAHKGAYERGVAALVIANDMKTQRTFRRSSQGGGTLAISARCCGDGKGDDMLDHCKSFQTIRAARPRKELAHVCDRSGLAVCDMSQRSRSVRSYMSLTYLAPVRRVESGIQQSGGNGCA